MWEIWANLLLPKALKSCPKCKKSPNLVTLSTADLRLIFEAVFEVVIEAIVARLIVTCRLSGFVYQFKLQLSFILFYLLGPSGV